MFEFVFFACDLLIPEILDYEMDRAIEINLFIIDVGERNYRMLLGRASHG
jgi:hypothetical protein